MPGVATELLERAAEQKAIGSVLDEAAAGVGELAVIEGLAGLGKTSMLSLAARMAEERGFRVLRAAGDELEAGFPWGVAIQLFGEILRDRRSKDLLSGAAGRARYLLERAEAPSPAVPAGGDAFPLLHALYWLTANLSLRDPVLLIVDDGHWSDPESLRFCNHLAARIEELRAALIVSVRPGTPVGAGARGAADLLARISAHPRTRSLRLEALSQPSIRLLVRGVLPHAEDEFGDAIAMASGGNPFLARELTVAARAEGLRGTAESVGRLRRLRPEGIRNAILVRLAGLGRAAADMASAVAVLGPSATPELAGDMAGLDGPTAARAIDALATAEILVPGERLAFVHPVVREVVHGDLPVAGLRQDHTKAARLLHERGGSAEAVASQLHAGEAVPEGWAIAALRDAARAAMVRGAPEIAARHLGRALASSRDGTADPELLLEAGQAELAAADPAAIGHLEAAADSLHDISSQAAALGTLARARFVLGDIAGAVRAAQTALDAIPPGTGGLPEASLLFALAVAARSLPGEMLALERVLSQPRLDADGRPAPAEIVRQATLAFNAALRGDRAEARERISTPLRWLDESDADAATQVANWLMLPLAILGDYDDVERRLDPILDRARRHGSRLEIAQLLELRVFVEWLRGNINGGLADSETVLELWEQGWDVATIPIRVARASLLIERGEVETAMATLQVPEEAERRLPGTWGWIWLPYGRALVAAAFGNWSASLDQALAAGERASAIEATSPDFIAWRSVAARAAARLGETDRAASLIRDELDLARAAGSARASAVSLATLGAIEGGPKAIPLLEHALAELERVGAALESTRARVELGIALRRERRPRDAREPLRRAVADARGRGAVVLAERALAELRAAGGRSRRTALAGPESLTPSERRVAEMVADGMSNREIAEALFVSLRTVETHLTHSFAKLQINSRRSLPAALRRQSTAD